MGLLIKFVLIAFLVGALQQMPYGYYPLIRVIILLGCAVLMHQEWKAKQPIYVIIYGIIAIVYFPIIEYGFKRAEWQVINKITIGAIGIPVCLELMTRWLKNR